MSYPTVGKLNKIYYNTEDPAENLRLLTDDLCSTVAGKAILSLELPVKVIREGKDDMSKQVLSLLAPSVDRIYAEVSTSAEADQLRELVSEACEDTEFVPIFHELPASFESSALIR